MSSTRKGGKLQSEIPGLSKALCMKLLNDLEKGKRPVLHATKCSLDNAIYNHKVGYFTPGGKKVATELNVSSVKKCHARFSCSKFCFGTSKPAP